MTDPEFAPILAAPHAAFPEGTFAVWYRGAGGRRLRAAYCPAPNPIGSVVLSPGRTEHLEKYVEVMHELVERGFSVVVHDWRGQGLSDRLFSDRLRGYARGFDDFLIDLKALVERFDDRLPHPRIALGHSMGGCLTLMAAARGQGAFDGLILSAPMLGIKTGGQPYALVRVLAAAMTLLGRGADYILGGGYDPFAGTLEADGLTHDPVRYHRTRDQLLANRDLALGNVTWAWVDSALRATEWIRGHASIGRIEVPVTVVGAGDDRLVDNAAQRAVVARLPRGRYVEVPGALHEILMETDELRAPFWREFDALAAAISPPA